MSASPSFPHATLQEPQDPTQLHLHHAHCAAALGRMHRLGGLVEAVDAFVSPRFLSTLTVLALLAAGLLWLGA